MYLSVHGGPVVIVTGSFAEMNRSQMFNRLGLAALASFSLLTDSHLVETNVMDASSVSACA